MERICLVGGSGFIGKNLIEYFAPNYEVMVVDKYIDEKFFAQYPHVKIIKIELDKNLIPNDVGSPDYIINLASIVTAERDLSLFEGMISSNLKVLLNLYERFKDDSRLKLFIQFGSSEEYGNEGSPFKETMREVPNSPYALVKQLTVNTVLMLQRNYSFPAMVVRPSNLFGKYQDGSKFIPYVISQLKANNPLEVTQCEQKRDFIYAKDFAWCIGALINNWEKCIGEIVNVASGESVSLKQIIDICRQITKSSSEVHYGALPYRENEVMDLRCDITKFQSILGCEYHSNTLCQLVKLI